VSLAALLLVPGIGAALMLGVLATLLRFVSRLT
jgi:hypothetical protein